MEKKKLPKKGLEIEWWDLKYFAFIHVFIVSISLQCDLTNDQIPLLKFDIKFFKTVKDFLR